MPVYVSMSFRKEVRSFFRGVNHAIGVASSLSASERYAHENLALPVFAELVDNEVEYKAGLESSQEFKAIHRNQRSAPSNARFRPTAKSAGRALAV